MFSVLLSFIGAAIASEKGSQTLPAKAKIDWMPFEPHWSKFYDPKDKFHHPLELISPKFDFPFEMRRAALAGSDGEAVILVTIDETGFAARLSVLSSTDELFVREAINGLQKARWDAGGKHVAFYYKATFLLLEK